VVIKSAAPSFNNSNAWAESHSSSATITGTSGTILLEFALNPQPFSKYRFAAAALGLATSVPLPGAPDTCFGQPYA